MYGHMPPEELMSEYYGLHLSYDKIEKKYPGYIKWLTKAKNDVKPIYNSYEEMLKIYTENK